MLTRLLGRWAFPALPIGFAVVFVVLPLALTIAVSFWTRVGLLVRPAFTFTSYEAFFAGARLLVLERSFLASIEATANDDKNNRLAHGRVIPSSPAAGGTSRRRVSGGPGREDPADFRPRSGGTAPTIHGPGDRTNPSTDQTRRRPDRRRRSGPLSDRY